MDISLTHYSIHDPGDCPIPLESCTNASFPYTTRRILALSTDAGPPLSCASMRQTIAGSRLDVTHGMAIIGYVNALLHRHADGDLADLALGFHCIGIASTSDINQQSPHM